MSWQQPPPPGTQPPPMGFYPGQTGPAPGFYPGQGGYPTQGAGYPGYPPGQAFPGVPPPYGQAPPPQGIPFAVPPPIRPDTMYGGANNCDAEDPLHTSGFDFSDKTVRHGFVRKVYGILMVQLLATLAVITLFMYHMPTKLYVQRNVWVFWVAFVVMFVTMMSMACCTGVRRKAPMNFIFLGIFTLAESLLLGVATSHFNAEAVLMAVGICAGVCLALTLFALQTKWDFTMMGGMLFVALVVLMIFGIVAMFLPGNRTVTLVYASLGAILFSMYLVYDTQLMLGGKHKCSISPEEYIFAALNLYLDIIQIFLYILTIIGASSRD